VVVRVPELLDKESYNVWVPIEDSELFKSLDVDENGDYIVQGLITSEEKDEEDDVVDSEGADCSYLLEKGWIKYEHGNNPRQFIGEPLECKVGQFEHPGLHKLVKGIYIKGRLFAGRALTKEAVETMEDLQKSKTKRRMGFSIEAGVKERCKKTGRVLKSIVRNVVLTMNPVNTTTWAELAKSFVKNHELVISMEKAIGLDNTAEIRGQSLEGSSEVDDDTDELIAKLFKDYNQKILLDKSLSTRFITSSKGAIELGAFDFAVDGGLGFDKAEQFALYIADHSNTLKAFIKY
jgi:hypothetical protein